MANNYVMSIGSSCPNVTMSSAASMQMKAASSCAATAETEEDLVRVPGRAQSPSFGSMNTNFGSEQVSNEPSLASVKHETVQRTAEHSEALTIKQRVLIAKIVRRITKNNDDICPALAEWCAHLYKPISGDLTEYTALVKKIVTEHYDDLVELKKQLVAIKERVELEKVIDNIAAQVVQCDPEHISLRAVCDVLHECIAISKYIEAYPTYVPFVPVVPVVPVKSAGCCVIM